MTNASRKTRRSRTKASAARADGHIEVSWTLGELPSSQHRAGLAGLVMCVRYLARTESEGVCELVSVTEDGATLRVDAPGMKRLFDVVYAASTQEIESTKPFKNSKTRQEISPLRTEQRSEVDPKTQKPKERTVYVYPQTIPKGAPVLDVDPTRQGDRGAYTSVWREVVWGLLRGVPAQRGPYEARAEGRDPEDWRETFEALASAPDASIHLASTYFLGAQDRNADNVPFRDVVRFQFLLHFWPLVAGVYVPQVEGREGKPSDVGRAIAIPDVADLEAFCQEYPEAMRARDPALAGRRPREALVALPVEGALAVLAALQARLAVKHANVVHLVMAVDVVHLLKDGNNVRLKSTTRLEPRLEMVDVYRAERESLADLAFRRQRIANLISGRPWYAGFERLFAELPHERFIGARGRRFATAARCLFDRHSNQGGPSGG